MTFKEINIIAPILRALEAQGYTQPTPIQEQAIPILLKGTDLLGCAQTGTGKTAAFAIPIIQQLFLDKNTQQGRKKIKALIVTPTRELAIQIADNFTAYSAHTHLKNAVIFGGVKQGRQTDTLKQGVDILVATPGRLLDLMQQGFISLKDVEYFVLDEADQMLDMGFIHDIKRLLTKLPTKRQSLFFSATMPQTIADLSHTILTDYQRVSIEPEQATAEKVEQAIYFVQKSDKIKLLTELLNDQEGKSTLVFSRTKHGADKIVKKLAQQGIKSAAIHGNKSQNARQKALGAFKNGELHVLLATDIAARGIDVSELSLVINFDLPNIPETYVHRIGRTGRAKASGIAISFCDAEERAYLKDIEKLIGQKVPVINEHDYVDTSAPQTLSKQKQQAKRKPSPSKGKPKQKRRRPNNNQ
ncbi:DEAD/DEAH box helicase [Flavicella sediminum]|uniref:DEAD/DEAH box helicase n=1 Tax=Flavicella sediminum TaxID=2585141 RepID=UPI001120AF80|nr:DEAD/DEAH box helicase [Flavicella sediminum]